MHRCPKSNAPEHQTPIQALIRTPIKSLLKLKAPIQTPNKAPINARIKAAIKAISKHIKASKHPSRHPSSHLSKLPSSQGHRHQCPAVTAPEPPDPRIKSLSKLKPRIQTPIQTPIKPLSKLPPWSRYQQPIPGSHCT
jgi:hypothetical protein